MGILSPEDFEAEKQHSAADHGCDDNCGPEHIFRVHVGGCTGAVDKSQGVGVREGMAKKKMDADTKVVLEALKTLKYRGERACGYSKRHLRRCGAKQIWEEAKWSGGAVAEVRWLGEALVMAGVLGPPVVAARDRLGTFCHPVLGRTMQTDKVRWYYPYDLLLWGCKEYVRRRRG